MMQLEKYFSFFCVLIEKSPIMIISTIDRNMKIIALICYAMTATCLMANAQEKPTINPTVTYINQKGEETESEDFSGEAPLIGRFKANPENVSGWNAYYEWRFFLQKNDENGEEESEPYLIRYEEDTEYTFNDSGTHKIYLYATFTQGNDTVAYTQDYWSDTDPLKVTISESRLNMPNAFSPNDDQINDIYRAKSKGAEAYQSIVEFHATIYNRWGQKLYEWDDPADGWDGTFHGSPVKQGVYFVHVKAKGADGKVYDIKRDVNLLRGKRENESSTSGGGETP